MNLVKSIISEFEALATDKVNDGILTNDNREDWHFYMFNEDHYIIGYWNATEWLKTHDIDAFEAISTCIEYENDNFGEVSKKYDNSEETVNMLAYVLGEQWINEAGEEFIADLLEEEDEE